MSWNELTKMFVLATLTPVSDSIAVGRLGYARIRLRRLDHSRDRSHILEAWSVQGKRWIALDDRIAREYRRDTLEPYLTTRIGFVLALIEQTGTYELTLRLGGYRKLLWEEADMLEQAFPPAGP